MHALFADRHEAALALAQALAAQPPPAPVVVLALPRGGVPIAARIARALHAPLDLLPVRKIGAPGQPELAVAALVDGDPPDLVVDESLCRLTGATPQWIDRQVRIETAELQRRRRAYLGGRKPVPVQGATAIVVDDGIATGTTMRAALRALRRRGPAHLMVAVPVAAADTLAALAREVDRIVCLATPTPFTAIGCHYADFHQVGDAEVLQALAEADAAPAPGPR